MFAEALAHFEAEKRKGIIKGDEVLISIWGRALEHAKKIALVCEDGYRISGPVAQWSVDLVTLMVEGLLRTVRERIVENQTHAETNLILQIIGAAGKRGITMKDLNLRTRGLDDWKREAKLNALVKDGTIVCVKAKTSPTAKKPATFYFLTENYDQQNETALQ